MQYNESTPGDVPPEHGRASDPGSGSVTDTDRLSVPLWRSNSFVNLWASDSALDLARQSSIVVIPLVGALTLGANPLQMGILGAATSAPSLLISLFAGVWVDRLPRRPTMVATSLVRVALVALIPLLWWLGLLNIWLLIGIAFLTGTMSLIFELCRLAWLPQIVGRPRLADANGKMEATRSVAQTGGPLVGGGAAGVVGPPLAMLVDAFSSLLSALFAGRIRHPDRSHAQAPARRAMLQQAAEGLRVSLRNPILRATIGASGMNNMFGHVFLAVYVLYMANVLGLTSFEIGLVFGVGGIGALIGSLAASRLSARFGVGRTITVAWLFFGLGGLPIPLAFLVPEYALILVVASEFVQWMVLPIADVNQLSLRQAITPDQYLGRVSASYRFIVYGLVPVGSLIGGGLGTLIGLQATLLVGVFGMLVAFVWIALSPVRAIESFPAEPQDLMPAPGD